MSADLADETRCRRSTVVSTSKAFDLEFKARAAPLDHPNIVPLLYRGRDPDTGDS
jgi:hypothetical protein